MTTETYLVTGYALMRVHDELSDPQDGLQQEGQPV